MDAKLPIRIQAKIAVGPDPPDPYLVPWTLGGCWIWTAVRDRRDYGKVHDPIAYQEGLCRTRLAHVVVYELLVGPVPEGKELDHLCRVHSCVRPTHMDAVTHRVNLLRGDSMIARQAAQTHCHAGHQFDEKNTRINKRNGKRVCRACHRDRERKRRRMKGEKQ